MLNTTETLASGHTELVCSRSNFLSRTSRKDGLKNKIQFESYQDSQDVGLKAREKREVLGEFTIVNFPT